MEDLKKAILVRNGMAVGVVGDKYFSTAPLGTVLSFAGQTAPHGYLLCDGASYKVADYPHLYAVIGNTYGGDTENFNVPNLVDKFIQGSTTSGTEKEAGLPNIEGTFGSFRLASTVATESGAFRLDGGTSRSISYNTNEIQNKDVFSFDASRSNSIYGNSDTVQPPALTMVYIIKAFHTNEGVDSNDVTDQIVEYVEGEIDGLLDDSSTSETSTWSSSKIASELKTSSNTDKVIITPNTEYFTQTVEGHDSFYVVRNGVCYVNLDIVAVKAGSGVFNTTLPKTISSINITISPFDVATEASSKNAVLTLYKAGTVQSFAVLEGRRYMCNFSYPIA